MSANKLNIKPVWIEISQYLVLALLVVLIVGILLISYSTGLFLLMGAVFVWPIRILFRLVTRIPWGKIPWGSIIVILLFIIFLWLYLFSFQYMSGPPPPNVQTYKVRIEQISLTGNEFIVKEEGIFNCGVSFHLTCSNANKIQISEPLAVSLTERKLTSTSRGLLVKELYIEPFQANKSGYVSLTLPDGTSLKGALCKVRCPTSSIELLDFPRNSFYEARDAKNLQVYPYINTETITWTIRDLEQGIRFAYITPPFHHLRSVLKPLFGVASLNQWIVGLIGLIGALIITPVIKPVLIDIAQNKLKSRFKKTPKEVKKANLVISDKGEEKEIEVDE